MANVGMVERGAGGHYNLLVKEPRRSSRPSPPLVLLRVTFTPLEDDWGLLLEGESVMPWCAAFKVVVGESVSGKRGRPAHGGVHSEARVDWWGAGLEWEKVWRG